MATINISFQELQLFFLVFLRVAAIMLMLPVFGSRKIPSIFKAGLALAVAVSIFPLVDGRQLPYFADLLPFAIGIITEVILGIIIGFSIKLIFAGIQFAGHIGGFQMGMALANVLDPMTGAENTIMAQFHNLIAMLIFISINAHHWFIRGMVESFRLIPPLQFQANDALMAYMVSTSFKMFIIAIQVGAPIIAAMLFLSVVLGLIARTVPQMHILIVAMPLKILIGLLIFVFTLPYLVSCIAKLFGQMGKDTMQLLLLLG